MLARRRGIGFADTGSTDLPACSSMPPVPSTFQGPFASSGNQSDVPRYDASVAPVTQAGLDAVWQYLLSLQPQMQPQYSFTDFLNANWKPLVIGGLIFFGLLAVTRR